MFKSILFVALTFFLMTTSAFCEDLDTEKVARSTVFLSVPVKNSPEILIGTGFLLKAKDRLFLVTAEHVAKLMTKDAKVTYPTENDIPKSVGITEITGSNAAPDWFYHGTADVAVIYLKPDSGIRTFLISKALDTTFLVGDLEAPRRDFPLTVVGFPKGLGIMFTGPDKKMSAISKVSRTASGLISLPRFDNNQITEMFLLDTPSVGGFSGAPLFTPQSVQQGTGFFSYKSGLLFGLMHGTLGDDTGGKFAAVVPSKFIVETLNRAYRTTLEAELAQSKKKLGPRKK